MRQSFSEKRRNLIKRFQELLGKCCVIYGAGGDFSTLVSPYLKSEQVVAIIDSSEEKIGKRIIGKIVQSPRMVCKYLNNKFLISSYRYQNEIQKFLKKKGVGKPQIITLEDIFRSDT
jgi:FlaA1/EpsC-like NDP-sugar epimerase